MSLTEGPKCPKGAEVEGAEVVGAEVSINPERCGSTFVAFDICSCKIDKIHETLEMKYDL